MATLLCGRLHLSRLVVVFVHIKVLEMLYEDNMLVHVVWYHFLVN